MLDNRFSLLDDTFVKQKQHELQRQAEYNRLIKEAEQSRPLRTPVSENLRLWIGHRLIAAGEGLVKSLECPELKRVEFT